MNRRDFIATLGATAAMCLPLAGHAQAGSHKKIPPGQIKRQKSGPKPIPPGQIKRYTRGDKLPIATPYTDIGDWKRWGLGKPPKGQKYVRVGDQVLRVVADTLIVMAVIGLANEILN